MANRAIVNASPLIFLSRAGHLDLLRIQDMVAAGLYLSKTVLDAALGRVGE